jgi:hypothetical protein
MVQVKYTDVSFNTLDLMCPLCITHDMSLGHFSNKLFYFLTLALGVFRRRGWASRYTKVATGCDKFSQVANRFHTITPPYDLIFTGLPPRRRLSSIFLLQQVYVLSRNG